RPVDLDQYLFLASRDRGIAVDRRNEISGPARGVAIVEDARAHVKRFGRDLQTASDGLEDVGRWFAQSALDLAQIRIRNSRALAELAQRKTRVSALIANELTEIAKARLDRLERFRRHHAVPATCLAAISRSKASMTLCMSRRRLDSSRSNGSSCASVDVSSS